MNSKIKLKEQNSDQVLYEFALNEIERAYAKALECEKMGVEVSLDIPSVPESLLNSLGADSNAISKLKEHIQDEIDSHGSCCDSEIPKSD